MYRIIWTDYLRYRAELRGFDLAEIERIMRFGEERYFDAEIQVWVRHSWRTSRRPTFSI
jgi:hypothetical protein